MRVRARVRVRVRVRGRVRVRVRVHLAEQVGASELEDVDRGRGGRAACRAACGHHPRGLSL